MKKLYIVYDARAMYDVDEALVLTTAESLKEAIEDAKDYGEVVVYSYDIGKGNTLINPKFEEFVHDN